MSRINLSKIILVDNTGEGNVPMTGANVALKMIIQLRLYVGKSTSCSFAYSML